MKRALESREVDDVGQGLAKSRTIGPLQGVRQGLSSKDCYKFSELVHHFLFFSPPPSKTTKGGKG